VIPKYNTAYIKGVALSADLIVPKFNNYSVEYLCNLCYEIVDTIKPLIELNNTQDKE